MKRFHKIVLSLLILVLSLTLVASAADMKAGKVDSKMAGNELMTAGNGAVYTENNDVKDNRIIRFERAADGPLKMSGNFSTHGKGTGASLENQGGVILTDDGKNLLAVNAGSNEISVFQVNSKGLKFTGKVSSKGKMPISLTAKNNLVYVVNTGGKSGSGNIVGYRLSKGNLTMIPNSIRPLSKKSADPAEIDFNPDGNVLVVTEKATNVIDTYTVGKKGAAKGPIKHVSNGKTPFGFAFNNKGYLVVSEADKSTASSYAVSKNGSLKLISGSVPNSHSASCWVVITKNGKFAYVNNARDGTTSSYSINDKGKLSLLKATAGKPGAGNIDLALSDDSKFLYSLNSKDKTIAAFNVNSNGSLTPMAKVSAPLGAGGLAAR